MMTGMRMMPGFERQPYVQSVYWILKNFYGLLRIKQRTGNLTGIRILEGMAMFGNKQNKNDKDLLIFLDIDGVLNTSDSFNTKYELHSNNLDALADLISSGKKKGFIGKVVLISTWRLGYVADYDKCSPQVKNLVNKLSERGIPILGKTPIYKDKTRDVEILRYIREYSLYNGSFTYITLDDDLSIYDRGKLGDINLYKVNQNTGLVKSDVAKIMKTFGAEM